MGREATTNDNDAIDADMHARAGDAELILRATQRQSTVMMVVCFSGAGATAAAGAADSSTPVGASSPSLLWSSASGSNTSTLRESWRTFSHTSLRFHHFDFLSTAQTQTCSRFLQSFALPNKVVQLQLSWGTLRGNQPPDGSICLSPPKPKCNERFARPSTMVSFFFCNIFYIFSCYPESSKTPQHSKWNCVGTNRQQHKYMYGHIVCDWTLNTPKIRIVQKNNFRSDNNRIRICYLIPKAPEIVRIIFGAHGMSDAAKKQSNAKVGCREP